MKILLISSLLLVAAYGGPLQEESLNEIIETVNRSGAKWKAGQNFGEHTTIASLKRLMGARRDGKFKVPLRENHNIPDSSIPESFDSRENWYQCASIRHIRDQGNCGSCWAVSAVGAFTDRLCIATDGLFTLPLSAEELLACCEYCGDGCKGGYPESAWAYFESPGLVTGGDYNSNVGCQPYEIPPCSHHVNGTLPSCDSLPTSTTPKCQKECTNSAYTAPFLADRQQIKYFYGILDNVEGIQRDIIAHGPVQATFDVYADFLTYKSGVYHHVTGSLQGGHAVKIIGWGVEDGTPYWLIANNWNGEWGDKGFFKILRGRNECGIESDIIAGIPIV